jgi:hypothetical protein
MQVRNPSNLKKHITDKTKKINPKINIRFTNGFKQIKNAYLDVQHLYTGLDLILNQMLEDKSDNDLIIDCERLKSDAADKIMLSLTHENSFNQEENHDENVKLYSDLSGLEQINSKLMNVCDWSIASKFKDGDWQFNYLISSSSNSETFDEKCKREVSGFRHILTFHLPHSKILKP